MNELTGADFKSATADDNKKLFIETYGCQMNVADSEVIASVMQMAGYSVAETLEEADAVFMNTCSIWSWACCSSRPESEWCITSSTKRNADTSMR